MPHIIVGFFCGTGIGYSEYSEIKDQSFLALTDYINEASRANSGNQPASNKVHVYGYDGCPMIAKGVFAIGIEKSANDLYEKLRALSDQEPIKLILIAHSRGCFSALSLVLKINADPELKQRVQIVLDFRDPVPGNLKVSAAVDFAKMCLATQFKDLSHCETVVEAYITIQEKGMYDIAFSVFIPKFHPRTRLNVEYLPGIHDIQVVRSYYERYCDKFFESYYSRSKIIYKLGLKKSLQIMLTHGVGFSGMSIKELMDKQIKYYQTLLDIFMSNKRMLKNIKQHARDLHFGGHFVVNKECNAPLAFNARHACLLGNPDCQQLLIFKGKRPDLIYTESFDKRVDQVISSIRSSMMGEIFSAAKDKYSRLIKTDSVSSHGIFSCIGGHTERKQAIAKIEIEDSSSVDLLQWLMMDNQKGKISLRYCIVSSLLGIEAKTDKEADYMCEKLMVKLEHAGNVGWAKRSVPTRNFM